MKRNDGFTLIELLVTVSVGTLVTFAAVSLLLLGARVQYRTTREAEEQQTVRIVMSLLENMAGSGAFNEIVPIENNSWQLWNCARIGDPTHTEHDGDLMFTYDAATGSIYRNAPGAEENEPLLTGLNNAVAIMEGESENVLRLSFETNRNANYVTRVYCRTVSVEDRMSENDEKNATEHAENGKTKVNGNQQRIDFLNTVAGEYNGGKNTGMSPTMGKYYSQWYIGSGWGTNGWNKDTPWCACFLSWAADQNNINGFKFANVDAGMELFKQAGKDDVPDNGKWMDAESGVVPTPGDYVFFDWTGAQKDPAHVGVVLEVDTEHGFIYTIEGNSSGRVAVRKYDVNDPVIMGYGILPGFEAAAIENTV